MKYLVLLVLITSCAANRIILKEESLRPYKEMSQISKVPYGTKTIWLEKIVDNRTVKHLGNGFTGVQYEKTPIWFEGQFDLVMKDIVQDSFEARNIALVQDGELALQVEVNDLWVQEVIEKFQPETASCKVNMTFHLIGAKEKWSGKLWTEYKSGGDLSDGSERIPPTLASCLNEIFEKLANHKEFLAMIKKDK